MNKKLKQLTANLNPKTKLIILLSLVAIFLTITTIIIIKDRVLDAKIDLLIAPDSSTIEIDGHKYTNGKHNISSGKHTIKISKDDFESKEEEIEIKKGETYIYYNYLLQPNNSMKWYEEHEDDSLLLETIIPALSNKKLQALQDKYPLLTFLPINENYYINNYSNQIKYSISYKIENEDQVVIYITDYNGVSTDLAKERIKSLGFNLEDYTIKYSTQQELDGWAKAD